MSTPGKLQFMSGPNNRWARAAVGSGRPWTSCLSRFMHSLCPEPGPPNYPLIYPKYPQLRAIRTLPLYIYIYIYQINPKYRQSRAIGTLSKGLRALGTLLKSPLGGPGRGCGESGMRALRRWAQRAFILSLTRQAKGPSPRLGF